MALPPEGGRGAAGAVTTGMSTSRSASTFENLGEGLVGSYRREGRIWWFEGSRPGPDWHRHDWRPRRILVLLPGGPRTVLLRRRRWRLAGTTKTRLDRSPDEVGRLQPSLLVLLLLLWTWISSGKGLHGWQDSAPSLASRATGRSVHRWFQRLIPDAPRLLRALRTAAIERAEPKPIEKLFPGGLSPPGAVGRRRWKDPEAVYSLASALAFLFDGALALKTSATVLLAEARRRLDGPLGSTAT